MSISWLNHNSPLPSFVRDVLIPKDNRSKGAELFGTRNRRTALGVSDNTACFSEVRGLMTYRSSSDLLSEESPGNFAVNAEARRRG